MTMFDEATTAVRTEAGRYRAELSPKYRIGDALNGGYLMAVLLSAARQETEHPHPVSTAAHFLRVATPGPAEIAVTTLKSGRTVTVLRAELLRDGQVTTTVQAVFAALDPDAKPEHAPAAPELPPIDGCVRLDPRASRHPSDSFVYNIELRFSPDSVRALTEGADHPELRGYVNLPDPRPNDGLMLALAVDALPPVVSTVLPLAWAPTVELTWQMRNVPADGPLGFTATARQIGDGWFDENVELWDPAGRLVAQSRQLARVGRPPAPVETRM
ncbi:acyl-CoA thioesterase [Allonocardiopsis opalescens]|uniref:Acyl-CoA thioesterase n=1 Tax=Allonocardiopsis opalescens TaxID=1144618 RepID=A0A2T0Q910_9ACTN|nr:thioesterase family protein [Allonocardiopsis opalescens]PRY00376.1 acyl-CoA thioesterase [Allonocardiopsis opalescens]